MKNAGVEGKKLRSGNNYEFMIRESLNNSLGGKIVYKHSKRKRASIYGSEKAQTLESLKLDIKGWLYIRSC
ncbi:hypothetical protein Csa_010825 [Cucumis sativus]|uniref:Uncharacterized protein n=1 Tax=Cucumis sativus TaxID=3659 RepID=A0A0A0L2B8_CUCSA|nr:hypothetical protein Csa_010825 [Cucumis sativus]